MAKGEALPSDAELSRWIKRKYLGRDEDDKIIVSDQGRPTRVFPEAFELKPDEDGLSVTWLQFFAPARVDNIPASAEAVRQSMETKVLPDNSAFAVAPLEAVAARASEHH